MCIHITCEQKWKGLVKHAVSTRNMPVVHINCVHVLMCFSAINLYALCWGMRLFSIAVPCSCSPASSGTSPFPSERRWSRGSGQGPQRQPAHVRGGCAGGARGCTHLRLRGHQHPPTRTNVSIHLPSNHFSDVMFPSYQSDTYILYTALAAWDRIATTWINKVWHAGVVPTEKHCHVTFTQHC